VALIMGELERRGRANPHTLAYQSRVGPVEWLKPYTDDSIRCAPGRTPGAGARRRAPLPPLLQPSAFSVGAHIVPRSRRRALPPRPHIPPILPHRARPRRVPLAACGADIFRV
jgi:hypothetical protein